MTVYETSQVVEGRRVCSRSYNTRYINLSKEGSETGPYAGSDDGLGDVTGCDSDRRNQEIIADCDVTSNHILKFLRIFSSFYELT